MAASRGVTSLRPLRPVGAARLAASESTGGAPLPGARWEGRGENVVPTARFRQATVRREARPSCPRADRSPGDDGWVAHLLAAVHPAHVPIPRFERASEDWSVRLAHARVPTVALPRLRVKRSEQRSRRAPDSRRSITTTPGRGTLTGTGRRGGPSSSSAASRCSSRRAAAAWAKGSKARRPAAGRARWPAPGEGPRRQPGRRWPWPGPPARPVARSGPGRARRHRARARSRAARMRSRPRPCPDGPRSVRRRET
jgi:hypothetical protein